MHNRISFQTPKMSKLPNSSHSKWCFQRLPIWSFEKFIEFMFSDLKIIIFSAIIKKELELGKIGSNIADRVLETPLGKVILNICDLRNYCIDSWTIYEKSHGWL